MRSHFNTASPSHGILARMAILCGLVGIVFGNGNARGQEPKPKLLTDVKSTSEFKFGNVLSFSEKYAHQLALTAEQTAKLKELKTDQQRVLNAQMRAKLHDVNQKPDSEELARKALADIEKRWLANLSSDQNDRLIQVINQARSKASSLAAGTTSPLAAEELRITPEQAEKIRSMVTDSEKEIREKQEAHRKEIERIRSRTREAVLAELDEQQRRTYRELFGDIVEPKDAAGPARRSMP